MQTQEERPLKRFLAKVISGGRVTIPEEMRLLHAIKEGSIIELKIIDILPSSISKRDDKHD